MTRGDLVRSKKYNSIGIIVEIFGDLDPKNPWIRVMFTQPSKIFQWCKRNDLELLNKEEEKL
jgi:rRNA processing protein Gar1|tara:strand:- start:751 stop:936 length:186 start_codon:yes stop_codon:yes gene_type:complete